MVIVFEAISYMPALPGICTHGLQSDFKNTLAGFGYADHGAGRYLFKKGGQSELLHNRE